MYPEAPGFRPGSSQGTRETSAMLVLARRSGHSLCSICPIVRRRTSLCSVWSFVSPSLRSRHRRYTRLRRLVSWVVGCGVQFLRCIPPLPSDDASCRSTGSRAPDPTSAPPGTRIERCSHRCLPSTGSRAPAPTAARQLSAFSGLALHVRQSHGQPGSRAHLNTSK